MKTITQMRLLCLCDGFVFAENASKSLLLAQNYRIWYNKKRMWKRGETVAKKLLYLLAVCCLFCGCAAQPVVEELLRAPQLSAQLSIVQKALNSYLGESAQLKYPRTGTISSPFLFGDLNGDGKEEAVVLYQSESKGLNVHIAVLEQNATDWVVTQEIEGPSTDVESVSQANLQDGKGNELVILYSAPAKGTEDYLAVYSYYDKTLKEKSLWPCMGYLLEDITGSGNDDLVMIRRQDNQLSATILTGSEGELKMLPDLPLDQRFVSCEGLLYSSKNDSRYIVVDGLDQSGYMISELISYNPQTSQLYQYTTNGMEDIVAQTARLKPGLYSADINQDGVVEIPIVEKEITTVNSARRLSFITWRDFTRKSNTIVQFGVLDMEYGFFLRLPIAWMDEIAVVDGLVTNSWQVCNKDGTQSYIDVVVYNKEKELPPILKDYQQASFIGKNRLMIKTNPVYLEQNEIIMKGIYLL